MPKIYPNQPSLGSLTAPDTIGLSLINNNARMFSGGRPSICHWPALGAVILADGVASPKIVVGSAIYRLGLLAPTATMTAAGGGTPADATLDVSTGSIGAGDIIAVLDGVQIKFVASLTPSPSTHEVLVGADDEETIDNLAYLIDSTSESSFGGGTLWNWASSPVVLSDRLVVTDNSAASITWDTKSKGLVLNKLHAYLHTGFGGGETLGSTGSTVGTVGYMANGTDGSNSAPDPGKYTYFYTFTRIEDGAESGPSPEVTEDIASAMNIALSGMTLSTDDTSAAYVTWYRNTADGAEFWPGAAVAATSDTDDITDTALTLDELFPYDENAFRAYEEGHIPRIRHVVTHKGRIFGAGIHRAAPRSVGTANVSNGSASVTMSTLTFEEMEGRTFRVDNTAEKYLIVAASNDTSSGAITLDRNYEGSNDTTASYTIEDTRDAYALYFSEPGKPNQWPTRNVLNDIKGDGEAGITGLVAHRGALLVFTEDAIFQVHGDDITNFSVQKLSDSVGCAEGNTIVSAEGSIFFAAKDGIYRMGQSLEKLLSYPDATDEIIDIDGAMKRPAIEHTNTWFGDYVEAERLVRMFLPFEGEISPRQAIVLSLSDGAWGLWDSMMATASCSAEPLSGGTVPLLGDELGYVWQEDLGFSDGLYGQDGVISGFTSSTVRSLTKTSASFSSLAGRTAWMLSGNGDLTGPVKIAAASGDTITFAEDLDSAPVVAGMQLLVGAYLAGWQSFRYLPTDGIDRSTVKDCVVIHSPKSEGRYSFSFAKDQDDLQLPTRNKKYGDLSNQTGRQKFTIQKRGILHTQAAYALVLGAQVEWIGVIPVLNQRARLDA